MNSDAGSAFAAVFGFIMGLAIIAGLIALIVWAVKKGNSLAHEADAQFTAMVQQMPENQRLLFLTQYGQAKKSVTTAVLLALFLGGLGIHKFYLGQPGLGVLYILFCWTYIPSIIALIECFFMGSQVRNYNLKKAQELIGLYSMFQAPRSIETKVSV